MADSQANSFGKYRDRQVWIHLVGFYLVMLPSRLKHKSISPSVYVAFNQLSATNLCGALGQTYYSTTLAFASNGLFTSIAPVIDNDNAPAALKDQMGEYSWTSFDPNDLLSVFSHLNLVSPVGY